MSRVVTLARKTMDPRVVPWICDSGRACRRLSHGPDELVSDRIGQNPTIEGRLLCILALFHHVKVLP